MNKNEAYKQSLATFKNDTKQVAVTSFCNSLSLFIFQQWLREVAHSAEERNKIKDEVFKAWSKQILQTMQPVLSVINDTMNEPKNRWASIIDGSLASPEDYQREFTNALKEIKKNFDDACREV